MLTPALTESPHFSPDSRVWVYTSNRALSEAETEMVQQRMDAFCAQWTAHNQALKAKAEVFSHQLLILMVDETQAGASGCSIDTSVHFLEALGASIQADFFERMRFGYMDENGALQFVSKPAFSDLVNHGNIHADTPVVNTLVQTKQQLSENWLLPFGQSWHRRLV